MPGADSAAPKASTVLEINKNHKIAEKLKSLYELDKDTLAKYSKILYCEAKLIAGMPIDNPKEFTQLISDLMI